MSEIKKIRRALNGCNGQVSFYGKPVYHLWESANPHETGDMHDMKCLGKRQETCLWIFENLKDAEHAESVNSLMQDWNMYQNGWLVEGKENVTLFYYLCQIGSYGLYRPEALKYLKKIKKK